MYVVAQNKKTAKIHVFRFHTSILSDDPVLKQICNIFYIFVGICSSSSLTLRLVLFTFPVRPETNVLDVAPEKFKLMLKELGIERTFSTLVALLIKKTD